MELMILKQDVLEDFFAGFNRHEWLAFSSREEYYEFLDMLTEKGDWVYHDGYYYRIAFIDLKTAKAVDKRFCFEGSFIEAFKERVVK